MREVSMMDVTIGTIKTICDTQTDCSNCQYKCGLDKLTLNTLCEKTIDLDAIKYPVRIGDILFEKYPCEKLNKDCSICELRIFTTIGDCEFPVCLHDFCNIIEGDHLEHFKDGMIYLSHKFIKLINNMEVVENGEKIEQPD